MAIIIKILSLLQHLHLHNHLCEGICIGCRICLNITCIQAIGAIQVLLDLLFSIRLFSIHYFTLKFGDHLRRRLIRNNSNRTALFDCKCFQNNLNQLHKYAGRWQYLKPRELIASTDCDPKGRERSELDGRESDLYTTAYTSS